jgi:ABC-type nitrate/sulfonate/bicarbonate transport system permease component
MQLIALSARAPSEIELARSGVDIREHNLALAMVRTAEYLRSPRPYLMLVGFALVLGFWHLSVEVWRLPRFKEMPGLVQVWNEWTSTDPLYGVSIHTFVYYQDIAASCRRIAIAFLIAISLGIVFGLLMGWARSFRAFASPVFELFRPIPVIAWIPLAIIMLPGRETPVIFLIAMAAFFATTINTMLGVASIDRTYVLAARCLGASSWKVFRHVIIPGAMPFIFTGLQIAMGVAWFSLVVGEMVAGTNGLGYRINASYALVSYPTMVISMLTLGFVGYACSALVRVVGNLLMRWRARELGL